MQRWALLIVLLCSICTASASVFNDDFSGDLSRWEVHQFGGSTMSIVDGALSLYCPPGDANDYGKAWVTPSDEAFLASWDTTLPYRVTFDFMIPNANNHWFFVYADSHVHTAISWWDEFVYQDSSISVNDGIVEIMHLVPGEWYSMRYDVFPQAGYFDIYVDDTLKVSNAGFLSAPYPPFQIGCATDTFWDWGFGYWDNFQLAGPVPEPSTLLIWSGLGAIGMMAVARREPKLARVPKID